MKKTDGRSKAARALRAKQHAEIDATIKTQKEYTTGQVHFNAPIQGMTGKKYELIDVNAEPMPDPKHAFAEAKRDQYVDFLHDAMYKYLSDATVPSLKIARHYLDTLITVLSGGPL